MSGQTQTAWRNFIAQNASSRPIAVRFHGLQPGQTPYVEIEYEDERDSVQRLLEGDMRELIAVLGGDA